MMADMVEVAVTLAHIDAAIGRADAFDWLPQLREHADAPLPAGVVWDVPFLASPVIDEVNDRRLRELLERAVSEAMMVGSPGVWGYTFTRRRRTPSENTRSRSAHDLQHQPASARDRLSDQELAYMFGVRSLPWDNPNADIIGDIRRAMQP